MNEMHSDMDKAKAITSILQLMQVHSISLANLTAAVKAQAVHEKKTGVSDTAARLFSILGGNFIFAGIAIYIGMFWVQMNAAEHIIVTLGIGLVLHVLAMLALRDARYERMVKPLFLVAAILQTGGWFVFLAEFFPHSEDLHHAILFVTSVMALQQGATFYRHRLTLLLFMTLAFTYGFAFDALDLLGVNAVWIAMVMGLSMMLVAEAVRKSPHYALSDLGYFLGSCLFFCGLFAKVQHSSGELLYLAAACGCLYISTLTRSNALLTVSTLAMLSYIGYFTVEHFVQSAGWPLSLLLLGAIFFAISNFSLRLKKRYITTP